MKKNVTTISLEMKSFSDFKPKSINRNDVRVERIEIPSPSVNHYFFMNVGLPWKWFSRLSWTLADWRAWVENDNVHTYIGYVQGAPFGYIELHQQKEAVEIAFFGVLPQFIDYGLGGGLLSEAIRLAWELDPKRVWVHTCTHDHKFALNNYLARGFSIFQRKTEPETIPDDDDPIWFSPDYYRSMAEEYEELGRHHAKDL